jgi:hypothetical protein
VKNFPPTPPIDLIRRTQAHLDAGWSFVSAHKRLFRVSAKTWYQWMHLVPELRDLNPHAKFYNHGVIRKRPKPKYVIDLEGIKALHVDTSKLPLPIGAANATRTQADQNTIHR